MSDDETTSYASAISYAYEQLKEFDNYGSGSLDVCVREVMMQVREMRARVDQLHASNSETENERRMWKSRALASRKLLDAVLAMWLQRFGADDADRVASSFIREVAERADRIEADAWSKAVGLAREFVARSGELMGDYAPDCVRPIDGDDPKSAFIARWSARFKEALG